MSKAQLSPLLFSLVFLCVGQPVHSQGNDSLTMQIVQGLAGYRSELLQRHPGDLKHVKKLMDAIRTHMSEEDLFDFVYAIYYRTQIQPAPESRLRLDLIQRFHNAEFVLEFTDEEFKAIARNMELIQLINDGILDMEYPFKLENPEWLSAELGFYDIWPGLRVGEVGAGNGMTSLLFSVIYDSLELFINEIDAHNLHYAEGVFERCLSKKPGTVFTPVQGRAKGTGLEGLALDRIIVQKSFHHFTDKKAMLASIRKSLAPDGLVLVMEADKNQLKDDPHLCPKAMTRGQILKTWMKSGFRLVAERQDEGVLHLMFEVK